jgi:mRNA interferase MazF
MFKDFDNWNKKKKEIHYENENRFYRPREIWWCSLGLNIGFEQDEKETLFQRPVLILKALSKRTCIILPLTTSKQEHPYRISIGKITGRESKTILSQIKVIDTKRLINRIAILDKISFEAIRKSAKDML